MGLCGHIQVDAVGKYFEGIGLAFQIIDDVINLRGIQSKVQTSPHPHQHTTCLLACHCDELFRIA